MVRQIYVHVYHTIPFVLQKCNQYITYAYMQDGSGDYGGGSEIISKTNPHNDLIKYIAKYIHNNIIKYRFGDIIKFHSDII